MVPLMNRDSEDKDQEGWGLSRRQFVRVVRDGVCIFLLPQALGCRFFQSAKRQPASDTKDQSQESYRLQFLTMEEAAAVEAVSARIIPTDETPGAKEARVVHFIDHMLATEYSAQQTVYREGLSHLNELTRARFNRLFSDLKEVDQDGLLAQLERREIEDWKEASDFFSTVRLHTIEGLFSDPKYHGHANGIGWQLMNTDGHVGD